MWNYEKVLALKHCWDVWGEEPKTTHLCSFDICLHYSTCNWSLGVFTPVILQAFFFKFWVFFFFICFSWICMNSYYPQCSCRLCVLFWSKHTDYHFQVAVHWHRQIYGYDDRCCHVIASSEGMPRRSGVTRWTEGKLQSVYLLLFAHVFVTVEAKKFQRFDLFWSCQTLCPCAQNHCSLRMKDDWNICFFLTWYIRSLAYTLIIEHRCVSEILKGKSLLASRNIFILLKDI